MDATPFSGGADILVCRSSVRPFRADRNVCPTIVLTVLLLAAPAFSETTVEFQRDIAPILERHCIRCHQPEQRQGDLSLATGHDMFANEYVVASKPDDSYLLDVVTAAKGDRPLMPKEGAVLSDAEVAMLRTWIKEGAKWPDTAVLRERAKADKSWWSLQPVPKVAPPTLSADQVMRHGVDWSANPVDRFVLAKLVENGLSPSPPADKPTLLRRATFDLTGLPPTPEEIAAFVADESPDAFERAIDRLLESPAYGERWGRHWLDVVRFGESKGYERNNLIDNIWPFRDYVIRSFNDDKPFNQFIREHLAGDVIGKNQPSVEVATAFLVAGPHDVVGNGDPVAMAQIRADTVDEIIRSTSEAFLGMTVGCARCHNHKFDPITQRDYYALYATFTGVQHGDREVATADARAAYNAATKPLLAEKGEIDTKRKLLTKALRQRADDYEAEASKLWTRPPHSQYETVEEFAPVKASYVRLLIEGDNNIEARFSNVRIDEFEVFTAGAKPRNVALASAGARAEGMNARTAKDFKDVYSVGVVNDGKYDQRWFVGGNELTIVLPKRHRINRVVFSSDRLKALSPFNRQATFVGEYRIEVSLDGKQWKEVANSYDREPSIDAIKDRRLLKMVTTADEQRQLEDYDRQAAKLDIELAKTPKLPSWWVGRSRKIDAPTHLFQGGDPQKKGETVVAESLSAFADTTAAYKLDDTATGEERRLALADWLTEDRHPLTPRVLANRVWHWHFGNGIVASPSDFGYMGVKPTHAELLDYLTTQLVESGWRLKPLHRLIMTSQAYRQTSHSRDDCASIDGSNRMLWRFSPRRLSAEELRDTMLTVAAKLDTRMGGPGFQLYDYQNDNVATFVPLDKHGPETYRRAVYHQNARASRVDLVSDFDCPDNAFSVARRSSTTTPLQALTLLNHSFTLDMSEAWAARLEREHPADVNGQIQRAFALAYNREPSANELRQSAGVIEKFGLRAFCRALFNTNELLYVR
jgi:hypothetical protein